MLKINFLFIFVCLIIELIKSQLVQKITLKNAQGETLVYPYVYSSYEGHSLIIFQGYGFSKLEGENLDCVFVSQETNQILRLPVLKDKTVCDNSDYDCVYWQTSYQFSNTQVGCYSPKISHELRLLIKPSSPFIVYLETSKEKFSCTISTDCTVIYSTDFTNQINWIYPQHAYFGSQIQFRISPKSLYSGEDDLVNKNKSASKLVSIKFGKSNCIVPNYENGIEDATESSVIDIGQNYGFGIIYCLLGEGIPETLPLNGFMMNYYTGFSNLKQSAIKTDLNGIEYIFKLFPKVDSVSTNFVSAFGYSKIIIKGKGFNQQQKIEIQVENSNHLCQIDQITPDTISCTTPILNDDLLNKIKITDDSSQFYEGGPGLKLKYFANYSDCQNLFTKSGFPDSGFLKEDIILETSTYNTQGQNYAEYADGYFKAPYDAVYRFYTNSDDASMIFLTYNNERKQILNFISWATFGDYVRGPSQYSEWIELKKGSYYIEIAHCQGGGVDHLIVGLEIKNSEVSPKRRLDTENRNFLTKQLEDLQIQDKVPKITNDRTFKFTIKPKKVARDLYEIKTEGIETNYSFICKNPPESIIPYKTIKFNNNITPADFIKNIGGFLFDLFDERIVVRKINLNENGEYFEDQNGELYSDGTYDSKKPFDSFYMENDLFSSPSKTGTISAYSFLFFVDRAKSRRIVQFETDCFFKYEPGNLAPAYDMEIRNILKKQAVSSGLEGYYQLSFGVFTTEQIPYYSSGIEEVLNKIPEFTNKVTAFSTSWGDSELINFNIRLNFANDSELFKTKDFKVAFNAITGGINDENEIIIEEVNTERNLNFFPIPSYFLSTINHKKQAHIRLFVNDIEAVCDPNICGFEVAPESISILSYSYDKNTKIIKFTIDQPFDENDQSSVHVLIGEMTCSNLVFDTSISSSSDPIVTTTNYNINCYLNQEIGGSYVPKILSKYGAIKNEVNTELIFDMTINDVNPTSAANVGGSLLTISGNNFPNTLDENLQIIVASAKCNPISTSNSKIICVLSKMEDLNSTTPLTITYKSAVAIETNNLFSFDTSYQSPTIDSINPNSVSPGEKQWVIIKLSKDISTETNLNDVSLSLVEENSKYTIKMNAVRLEAHTITAKYPGGPPGQYKLKMKLNENINIINEIDFEITHEIISVSPNMGSINGGTVLKITGRNFLKTQQNQMIMVGNNNCLYINNTETEIYCMTAAIKEKNQIDTDLTVSVDHVIQYFSVCKDDSTKCLFKYSDSLTPIVNSVNNLSVQDLISLSEFRKEDEIEIIGSNFGYASIDEVPNDMEFDWGKIEINKLNENFDFKSKLIAKIIHVYKFGIFNFIFLSKNGYSKYVPSSDDRTELKIILTCKDPVVKLVTQFDLSPFGAKFELSVDDIVGFENSPQATLNACGTYCKLVKKSLDNLSCNLILTTISDCNTSITISNFMGRTINVDNFSINKNYNASTDIISSVLIQNNSVSINAVNIITFTDKISIVFSIKNTFTDSINNPSPNVLMIINDSELLSPFDTQIDEINRITNYTYELNKDNFIINGIHSIFFHQSDFGYLHNSSYKIHIPLKILDTVLPENQNIPTSFNGGKIATMTASNLNVNVDSQILICGIIPAIIISKDNNQIVFMTPKILSESIFENKSVLTKNFENLNSNNIVENFFNTAYDISKLLDDNPFTFNSNKFDFVGIKIKTFTTNSKINLKILLKSIDIHISESSKPSDFMSAFIEGSNDGVNYETIMKLDKIFLTFSWRSISFDGPQIRFKFIRFNSGGKNLKLAEIRFFGKIVESELAREELICEAKYVDESETNTTLPHLFYYSNSNTLLLETISPSFGSSYGGNSVNFIIKSAKTLPEINFNTIIKYYIYDQPYQLGLGKIIDQNTFDSFVVKDLINNIVTFKILMPENPIFTVQDINPSMIKQPLKIWIDSIGFVYNDYNQKYEYVDRWSDMGIWGGEFVPESNFEIAYIKNLNVLLDVEELVLNMIIVENGSLIIEDERDYKIKVNNILIRSGSFVLGTEENPFKHKFDLELTAKKDTDASLPIFGNKVLAVLEGTLDMHGVPREPTWTVLSKSVYEKKDSITLARKVDWQVGEEIVIAASSFDPHQAEVRKIVSIDKTNPEAPVIKLDYPLVYFHYGEVEGEFDMRAEVGLLTRNIKIHGGSDSIQDLYGSHIMLASMKMNINSAMVSMNKNMDMSDMTYKQTVGRISYIETYNCGQAYQMGRYPIHFHMIGMVKDSYVKGCSIHDTFNRAITIHGVNYFIVENNVAYNTMGHSFFIEDGSETYNTIKNNLGILTRKSFSLLNSDITPATFWITNPLNYIENNHAGGSEHYGFWLEFPISPTGLNLNVKMCPQDMPLGSFRNNTSHSNEKYGLRIFPEMNPKTIPCEPIDNITNFPSTAILDNFTTYRNREKGTAAERMGEIIFQNFKIADNFLAGIDLSNIIPWKSYNIYSPARPILRDSFVMGMSKNPSDNHLYSRFTTKGVWTPRIDNFLVSNITFTNFDNSNMACFSSCSRCEFSSASTDSCARTIDFEKLKFDGSEVNKVIWNYPRKAIYRDLDGTLTGLPKQPGSTGDAVAYATPYYPHNNVEECKVDTKFEDGLVCDGSKVQVRRVAFYNAKPQEVYYMMPIKIAQMNKLGTFVNISDISFSDEINKQTFSEIDFKVKTDPNFGWAIPFVTNYNYLISFGNLEITQPLNFESLTMSRSILWNKNDKNININFNYTVRRDEFLISGKYTKTSLSSNIYKAVNTTFNDFGSFNNNLEKNYVTVHVNGLKSRTNNNPEINYSEDTILDNTLDIKARQCADDSCAIDPLAKVPLEDKIRLWSDPTSWLTNKIPVEGEDVVVKSGWNMVLDTTTPNLNSLRIDGKLSVFSDNRKDITLQSKSILVFGGRLEIGNEINPYLGKTIRIQLTIDWYST